MAALCLIASFAYLLREQGMVPVSSVGRPSSRVTPGERPAKALQPNVAPAISHPAADQPPPGSEMADMPGMAPNRAPVPAPGLGSQAPNAPKHDHAAHCPFCYTAAFALEAGAWLLGPVASIPTMSARPGSPQVHTAVLRHHGARAPPMVQIG
jgi:hypothetical protein